jgi:replicative DNA helicase
VIVDYLQRWASARRDFSEFRHVVSSLVSELRELALRIDNPILVISSQNRSGQGTALLTSLKESGELEYSADSAWFLVGNKERHLMAPSRAVDLQIEKNRYGDRGKVELLFRPNFGNFREV